MGWSIGYDINWKRDIGYGVPATCDHPGCGAEIDRGLAYVCGGEPYGGEFGCGLFFCGNHLWHAGKKREHKQICHKCHHDGFPYEPTPDVPEWQQHKLTDESWQRWRDENPTEFAAIKAALCQPDERSEAAQSETHRPSEPNPNPREIIP